MNQYKIYVGEKPFLITNVLSEELKTLVSTDGTLLLYNPDNILLKKGIEDLHASTKMVIALAKDTDTTFNTLKSVCKYIKAGGGLVQNTTSEYLFIFRNGRWDLPKGKLDDGESIEQCALREVREETGLQDLSLGHFMLTTRHMYQEAGAYILKQTDWFAMTCPVGQLLVPQEEEGIEAITWLKKDQWSNVLANTFASIKDVLDYESPKFIGYEHVQLK